MVRPRRERVRVASSILIFPFTSQTVATLSRSLATVSIAEDYSDADHQAYRLIADLRRHAIRVPEDCSVTGFDGIEAPPGMPQLTSIQVPFEEMGATSVNRLVNRIQNPSAHRRHNLVEGRLLEGQTTLPLPAIDSVALPTERLTS